VVGNLHRNNRLGVARHAAPVPFSSLEHSVVSDLGLISTIPITRILTMKMVPRLEDQLVVMLAEERAVQITVLTSEVLLPQPTKRPELITLKIQ
jgi:hypothetical protein